jgi:hypothetical protein
VTDIRRTFVGEVLWLVLEAVVVLIDTRAVSVTWNVLAGVFAVEAAIVIRRWGGVPLGILFQVPLHFHLSFGA